MQVEAAYQDNGYQRSQVGFNHWPIAIWKREQVDALKASLLELGVTEWYAEHYPFVGGRDYYAFFCEYPDCTKLEITVK